MWLCFCTIKILETSDTNDFKREILGGNAGTLSDNTVFRACSTNQFSSVSRAKVELDFWKSLTKIIKDKPV